MCSIPNSSGCPSLVGAIFGMLPKLDIQRRRHMRQGELRRKRSEDRIAEDALKTPGPGVFLVLILLCYLQNGFGHCPGILAILPLAFEPMSCSLWPAPTPLWGSKEAFVSGCAMANGHVSLQT